MIIIKKPGILPKLRVPKEGPSKVAQQNGNGTIAIEKLHFLQTITNIRRVEPYFIWQGIQQSVNDVVID